MTFQRITNVSAGKLGGLFLLNRTDSGLAVCTGFPINRDDSAAHSKHYTP